MESQPTTLHHEEGMEKFATVGGGDEFDETEFRLPMIEDRCDGVREPIKEKNRKGSWGNVNKKKKRMF